MTEGEGRGGRARARAVGDELLATSQSTTRLAPRGKHVVRTKILQISVLPPETGSFSNRELYIEQRPPPRRSPEPPFLLPFFFGSLAATMARQCSAPHANWSTRAGIFTCSIASCWSTNTSVPACPNSFAPHVYRLPSHVSAPACLAPAATATTPDRGTLVCPSSAPAPSPV